MIFDIPSHEDDKSEPGKEIPVPADENPPAPIQDPPFDPDQAPIDEGPSGPKKIV